MNMEIVLNEFLNSTLDIWNWSASSSARFAAVTAH